MQKLLFLHNRESALQQRRAVFQNMENPGSHGSENAEQNKPLNVDVKFNAATVFDDLGREAHQQDPGYSEGSIKTKFENNLGPGKTVKDAMTYLENQGCQTAAIMKNNFGESDLRFFAGPVGTNEIFLNEFYKPLRFPMGGEGTPIDNFARNKEKLKESTQIALREIRAQLPDVPPHRVA